MSVKCVIEPDVSPAEVDELFGASDFPDTLYRFDNTQIETMLSNSNLVVTARDGARLVGIAVSMTNHTSVCFLCSQVVHPDYQGRGVGADLVRNTHRWAGGDQVSLVTVSTPDATGFYENIGLERCRNAFIVPRKR